MELTRNSHHVFCIMYHFVWIPKYRHKVFSEPYRSSLQDIIQKIGYDYNIDIVELELPKDHIHMVAKSEPKQCPSNIMQIIKSISARTFFKLYPEIKKKYFWGGRLWTQSFFVETIGNANETVIRKYVRNQLKQMDALEEKSKQHMWIWCSVACGRVLSRILTNWDKPKSKQGNQTFWCHIDYFRKALHFDIRNDLVVDLLTDKNEINKIWMLFL